MSGYVYLSNMTSTNGTDLTNWIHHDVLIAGFECITEPVQFEVQWHLIHALQDFDMELGMEPLNYHV